MRRRLARLIAAPLALLALAAQLFALQGDQDYAALRARAEKLHAEGSYELAARLYERARSLALDPGERRWVEFRLADERWRSAAGSANPDPSLQEAARQSLEAQLAKYERAEERDRVWAELQESLGDYYWTRMPSWGLGQSLGYYRAAMDWWATSSDLALAKERWLAMLWRLVQPEWFGEQEYGSHGNWVPLDLLEDGLRLVEGTDAEPRARFLMARTLAQQSSGTWWDRRAREHFEAVLAAGQESEWYDDALHYYAEWLSNTGLWGRDEAGNRTRTSDLPGALRLYRRLVVEFGSGESRWRSHAQNRIAFITNQEVGVQVSQAFLPGSRVQYELWWRNVSRVDLALYPVELSKAVGLMGSNERGYGWLSTIDLAGVRPVREWTHSAEDPGDHQTKRATLELEDPPGEGAYVLTATAAGKGARDLLLVTDAALVAKASGRDVVLWATEAERGRPLAGAEGALFAHVRDAKGKWSWRRHALVTDEEGVARVRIEPSTSSAELFAAVRHAKGQAFVQLGSRYRDEDAGWRVWATTDRPAYRPDQKVSWKIVVRRHTGLAYTTPGGASLDYTIHDPRGADVATGTLELNAFGSAWGALDTKAEMALGEYRISFRHGAQAIGSATLFRLEEYVLPEFAVRVSVAEEDGRKAAYVLGDEVQVDVNASYYFGGAVTDAEVEVVVYQSPWWWSWQPPRRWDWFEEALVQRRQDRSYRGGQGQEILRRKLRTDSAGRARVTFPTPEAGGEAFEYRVEARVVDSSRREVVGSGSVRVARQSFAAFASLEHDLHRPGVPLEVAFTARDANDAPVAAEGTVRLQRARWVEVWRDPSGAERAGRALAEVRARELHFPPAGWRLVRSEYVYETVRQEPLATGADGKATWTVAPPGEGAYVVHWRSDDPRGGEVEASVWTWVLSKDTRDLAYAAQGVQIVLDSSTFEEGAPGHLMVLTEASGRHVLLTLDVGGELRHRVLALDGTVKLVTLEVGAEHVPNFHVTATMVHGARLFEDHAEVVVPPVKRFLDVTVATDRESYRPGESARVDVTVHDHEGRPVAAEVSLSLADEAVTAIAADATPDPRAFFYGHRRPRWVQDDSSLAHKALARLVENEAGEIVDERYAALDMDEEGRLDDAPMGRQYRGPGDSVALRAGGRMEKSQRNQTSAAPESDNFFMGRQAEEQEAGVGGGGGGEPAVVVRSDFRETALWRPDLVTGEDGRASVELEWPDSTTSWLAAARAVSSAASFGQEKRTAARTSMPLLVRLQAPRFLVAGDEATISALINNETDGPLRAAPSFQAEGLEVLGWIDGGELRPLGAGVARPEPVSVPPGGSTRVDWRVRAGTEGTATLTVQAVAGELVDAMRREMPVHAYGADVFASDAGKLTGSALEHDFHLPSERRPGTTRMTVTVAPSIATTMLDALPYLVQYPYGCTEQTLSRFVPAAVVAKTLADLGLSKELVGSRAFGGIEEAHLGATHPDGERDWAQLEEVMAKGLARIEGMQRDDGSFGWWGGGDADPYMSAYALWALTLAKNADLDVSESVLFKAATWVEEHLVEAEANPALAAWMMRAVAARLASIGRQEEHNKFMVAAKDKLWRQRDALNAYGRALFALACHDMGWEDEARTLARNLANGVIVDEDPGASGVSGAAGGLRERTAHWGEDGVYWRWSDGGVEATAFCLQALLAIEPGNELIAPAMTWLVKNRRGAQWKSTKDTAIVVLALSDYLRTSGELEGSVEYRLLVNGDELARRSLAGAELVGAPSAFVVPAPRGGVNRVVLERLSGSAPLYWSVSASFVSVEDPIPPRAADLFVRRDVYRLAERPTLLRGSVFERVRLTDGARVESGERVEVVLTVEAKNHLEYLAFEDFKAAGLEATELQSGGNFFARELRADEVAKRFGDSGLHPGGQAVAPGDRASHPTEGYTGRQRWVYRELRDRKVALFVDRLPEGVWEMRYTLRAQTPGVFRALPAQGYAMYVPEIRGNSAGLAVVVEDAD